MRAMGREVKGVAVIAVLLIGLAAPGPATAATGCRSCHDNLTKDRHVHGPVAAGDCGSCHQPAAGKAHPGQKESVVLTDRVGKICYQCHENKAMKKHVHSAVVHGDCISCHDPHHSPFKDQLKKDPSSLCLQCHETMIRHAVVHPPVAAGNCMVCHDPHQSDHPFQLLQPVDALCQTCHKKSLFSGKAVHQPVASGKCTACHDPHGSDRHALLKKNFPGELYVSYDKENFALCFECHNNDIAFDLRTENATKFRDGDRNLHTVHINRTQKGRTCKICHDVHAANQERLIREKIPGFGKWSIPINYRKTATGGTCIVGCHKPRSYDRFNDNYSTP